MLSLLVHLFAMAFAGPVPTTCREVIATPGVYLLKNDCEGTGPWLLDVQADYVTLDLGGHTLRCSDADPESTMAGIKAVYAKDFNLINGRVEGCHTGLLATHAERATVRGIDFSGQTSVGVNVGGRDHRILENRFEDIGSDQVETAYGIIGPGARSIVAGNTIKNVGRNPETKGIGIVLSARSTGTLIKDNTIATTTADPDDYPIWIPEGPLAILSGNVLEGYGEKVVGGTSVNAHFIPRG